MNEILLKILTAAVGSGASLLGAYLLVLWNRRRWGGCRASLYDSEGRLLDSIELGWKTAQSWHGDLWARKLGLKSLCSDNGVRLTCNVLTISRVSADGREFIVRLPPGPSSTPP